MRKKEEDVLDNNDIRVVELLSEIGVSRNLAKTLMYISQVKECRSADIERGADLRQPEVSVSIKNLQNRGWVKKRDLKNNLKGRPIHIYNVTKDLSEILKVFENEKLEEIENIKNDISELKNIISNKK